MWCLAPLCFSKPNQILTHFPPPPPAERSRTVLCSTIFLSDLLLSLHRNVDGVAGPIATNVVTISISVSLIIWAYDYVRRVSICFFGIAPSTVFTGRVTELTEVSVLTIQEHGVSILTLGAAAILDVALIRLAIAASINLPHI